MPKRVFLFVCLFVGFFGQKYCSQEAWNQSCTECKLSAWLTKEGYCPSVLYIFFFSLRKLQNNSGHCEEQVTSWKLRGAIGRSAQRGLSHVVFWLKMTNLGSDGQFQLPPSWLTPVWWIEILGPAYTASVLPKRLGNVAMKNQTQSLQVKASATHGSFVQKSPEPHWPTTYFFQACVEKGTCTLKLQVRLLLSCTWHGLLHVLGRGAPWFHSIPHSNDGMSLFRGRWSRVHYDGKLFLQNTTSVCACMLFWASRPSLLSFSPW